MSSYQELRELAELLDQKNYGNPRYLGLWVGGRRLDAIVTAIHCRDTERIKK